MKQDTIGTMYFCTTPIGNLEDITLRVLNTLKQVDIIAAEDTRHTVKLLNHFDIGVPLTSYHQHNEKSKAEELIHLLKQGKNIAVVSDAGMPGISDPGEELVQRCIQEGVPFTLLPGANAALMALVLSGLPTRAFVFEGFLSRDKQERSIQLERAKTESRTMVFYESPHRIPSTLKILKEHLGDRKIALGRELTKQYEEMWRGTLEEALEEFQSRKPRGEFVLVLEGLSQEAIVAGKREQWDQWTIQDHLQHYIEQGHSKKEAMKMVAKDRGVSRRDIYQYTIEQK